MATKTATRGELYVARESFATKLDGIDVSIVAGNTIVREGHELLERFPDYFELVEAHYEVESMTAAPGEKRKR